MADLPDLLMYRYMYACRVAYGLDVPPLDQMRKIEQNSLAFARGRLAARKRAFKYALKEAIK